MKRKHKEEFAIFVPSERYFFGINQYLLPKDFYTIWNLQRFSFIPIYLYSTPFLIYTMAKDGQDDIEMHIIASIITFYLTIKLNYSYFYHHRDVSYIYKISLPRNNVEFWSMMLDSGSIISLNFLFYKIISLHRSGIDSFDLLSIGAIMSLISVISICVWTMNKILFKLNRPEIKKYDTAKVMKIKEKIYTKLHIDDVMDLSKNLYEYESSKKFGISSFLSLLWRGVILALLLQIIQIVGGNELLP